MTDIEKMTQRIALVTDVMAIVLDAANADRKLSHDNHMNGHYTKALQELGAIKTGHETMMLRLKVVGR